MIREKVIRPRVLLLLLVNALLLLLLVYQITAMQQQENPSAAKAIAPDEPAMAERKRAHNVRSIDDYAEVVNRPLFNLERRPLELESEAQDEVDAQAFNLIGVVLTPEQQVAIIYSKNQKRPVKVAQWEWIDGWRLVSVQASVVELRKGPRSVELALQRASTKSETER